MNDHLIALADGWALWRWCGLRGAGFPVAILEGLAAPAALAAETELLACEAAAEAARSELEARCEAILRERGSDAARWARKAVRRLRQAAVPEPFVDEPALEPLRLAYDRRVASVATARAAFTTAFHAARTATGQHLRALAGDDRFQRAVLWQNRRALASGIAAFLRAPVDADDSKTRQNERLVASYAQRYGAKNDTIGFFGPFGWARFEGAAEPLAQRPGPMLEAKRHTYFEYWAIAELARQIAADPALRPYLRPRLLPAFRIEGSALVRGDRANALPPEVAEVVAACDGERSAIALAEAFGFDLAELCDLLGELAESGVVTWTLEVPTATHAPEAALAQVLASLPEAPRDGLDRLLARRAAIAEATTAPALEAALTALETDFTALTGLAAAREGGKTYAGRTLVYEDCRRDLELELGQPFLDRLGPPLALVLASARWFTHAIAARYRTATRALFEQFAEPVVDLQRFWAAAIALFPGPHAGIVADVRAELHRRWGEILTVDRETGTVERTAEDLADRVREVFAAPDPGWRAARHQCPDVLVAARGPAAFARGEYTIVLGETHVGFNTLGPLFVKEHPTPEVLIADRDRDLARPGIAPVWSEAITRGDYYSLSPRDFDLESGTTRSTRPRDHVIPVSALEVTLLDTLVVRTRDGAHQFDIIDFLEHHLVAESFSAFSLIASAARSPRIVIDDLVIARETWRIDPTPLAWPKLDDAAARFLAARRWARELGLPRYVFMKTPEETKPTYVDLASPILVDMLAKSLRAASAATLSEMLPAPDETWLEDAAGNRFTSELRIVAVDQSQP